MMARLLGFSLAFVLSCSPSAWAGQATTDAEAVAALEQRMASAWVNRDQETVASILAPDWTLTTAAGHVQAREQVLRANFGTADRKVESMTLDDVVVRMFGETAVATGRSRTIGSYRGTPSTVVLRFTDVFVRRDGRWQAVASQFTPAAP